MGDASFFPKVGGTVLVCLLPTSQNLDASTNSMGASLRSSVISGELRLGVNHLGGLGSMETAPGAPRSTDVGFPKHQRVEHCHTGVLQAWTKFLDGQYTDGGGHSGICVLECLEKFSISCRDCWPEVGCRVGDKLCEALLISSVKVKIGQNRVRKKELER